MNRTLFYTLSPAIGHFPGRIQTRLANGNIQRAANASTIGFLTHLLAGTASYIAWQVTAHSNNLTEAAIATTTLYLTSTIIPRILATNAKSDRNGRQMPFGDLTLEIIDQGLVKKECRRIKSTLSRLSRNAYATTNQK